MPATAVAQPPVTFTIDHSGLDRLKDIFARCLITGVDTWLTTPCVDPSGKGIHLVTPLSCLSTKESDPAFVSMINCLHQVLCSEARRITTGLPPEIETPAQLQQLVKDAQSRLTGFIPIDDSWFIGVLPSLSLGGAGFNNTFTAIPLPSAPALQVSSNLPTLFQPFSIDPGYLEEDLEENDCDKPILVSGAKTP